MGSFSIVEDEDDIKQLDLNSTASIYIDPYFTIDAANNEDAKLWLAQCWRRCKTSQ